MASYYYLRHLGTVTAQTLKEFLTVIIIFLIFILFMLLIIIVVIIIMVIIVLVIVGILECGKLLLLASPRNCYSPNLERISDCHYHISHLHPPHAPHHNCHHHHHGHHRPRHSGHHGMWQAITTCVT